MTTDVATQRAEPPLTAGFVEPITAAYEPFTRLLDVAIALVGLVLFLPVALALIALIRLDSPGPAIFRQRRIGRGGRQFTFYKFRTMYVDARDRFPSLYAYDYTPGEIRTMFFKLIEDPRLTRVGARLRRTSVDEIPNLINVLKGDLTLVGPRPEIPEMLRYYERHQLAKFGVKPGLTGLAQVNGRAILRLQETISADLEYVRRRSVWIDLWILLKTVKVVLFRVGAF